MLLNLTRKTLKNYLPTTAAPALKATRLKPLSSSVALLMGFALLTFGVQLQADELPRTSSGLAQFAQSANKKPKPYVQPEAPRATPEAPRAIPEGSPLNQSAQGVDAISSMLGTQPVRSPQIKPYQPPVKLIPSSPPERTAAPLVTDPSRINLERAVEKAFAADRQAELGGYKPVPEPLRTQAAPKPEPTPRYQPSKPKPAAIAVQPKTVQPTQTYRVVAGDSLSALSARSGVSISDLAALNNLSTTAGLQRGQSLKFPQGSLPAEPAKPVTQPKAQPAAQVKSQSSAKQTPVLSVPDNTTNYKVVAGDGLIALAKRLDMSTADLARLNNLSPTADLYVGQTLKVPAGAAPNPETYQVKRGDTLTGVAAQFGLSVSELAGYNDLSANANLRVAQTLKLTGSSSGSSAAASNKTAPASAELKNPSTYQVRSGDSLIQLARRFNLTTEALAEANGLSSRDQLQIGQSLKVPSLTQSYKVRSGDSLIALAKQYDISVQELAELNQIRPTAMLQIGQTLQVPAS